MILVIDSDEVMGGCIMRTLQKNGFDGQLSNNAIEAMNLISDSDAPEMVFLDVMLSGPDGFTFLNEMASYADTMKTPIVVVAEKDYSSYDLSEYNVVGFLDKNTMKPEEIVFYAREYA